MMTSGEQQFQKLLSANLGKREIVRRALAMIEQRDDQNARQLESINRLLARWDLLKEWLDDRIEGHSSQGRVMDEGSTYQNVVERMNDMEHGD